MGHNFRFSDPALARAQDFPLLLAALFSAVFKDIVGEFVQVGQKSLPHEFLWRKDNRIAKLPNHNLIRIETKSFGQQHGLALSAFKNLRSIYQRSLPS